MARNQDISDSTRRNSGESPEIEERVLDEGDRSPRSMEAAAADAFAHPPGPQRVAGRRTAR